MFMLIKYLCAYAEQGIVRNMKVAIKKLSRIDDFSEKQFEDELKCLKRVKHKNIVRFLGYCSDTPKEVAKYNGTYVLAENRRRILCFEYVPNKSLHDYIKGTKDATLCVCACMQLLHMLHITFQYITYFVWIVREDKTTITPGILISSVLTFFLQMNLENVTGLQVIT